MLTAQLPPPARLVPQVFVCEKSPVVWTLVIPSGPLPTLCTMTTCDGLAIPNA
jgi:hypothetical protein